MIQQLEKNVQSHLVTVQPDRWRLKKYFKLVTLIKHSPIVNREI